MNNPSLLAGTMGPQYYTAPDGTVVYALGPPPDLLPVPIDITGVKLTVAPSRSGTGASITLSAPTLPAGQILITGLRNLTPSDIGGIIIISNAADISNGTLGRQAEISNNGIFFIQALGTGYATESESVIILNPPAPNPTWPLSTYPGGSAPDSQNGSIHWAVLQVGDMVEGDPLAAVTKQALPLNLVSEAGPMKFADYDPTLPPVVLNNQGGVFAKVQRM